MECENITFVWVKLTFQLRFIPNFVMESHCGEILASMSGKCKLHRWTNCKYNLSLLINFLVLLFSDPPCFRYSCLLFLSIPPFMNHSLSFDFQKFVHLVYVQEQRWTCHFFLLTAFSHHVIFSITLWFILCWVNFSFVIADHLNCLVMG